MNLSLFLLGAVSGNWQIAGGIFFGILTGAILAVAGFTDSGRVKAAFRFGDKAIVLTFLTMLFSAVILAQIGARAGWLAMPATHNGFLLSSLCGGAICGIGLKLSGLAPFSAIGSIATGNLGAISAVAGMLLAVVAYHCLDMDLTVFLAAWDKPLGSASMTMDFFSIANPGLWLAVGLGLLIFIIRFIVKEK